MASAIESQKASITILKRIIKNYVHSNGQIRPHFIVSGASGTGKSFSIEQIARKLNIALVNINAAQLTREGISGNSLSKALEPLKKLRNKPVIVLLDEFDKLFNGVNGGTGDERSGVQSEILHIISSGTAQLIGDYGHYDEINTNNVLFCFGGAFLGEQNLSPEKLLRMGMFPELLGRVNLHVHMPDITVEELVKAMKKEPLLWNYFTNLKVTDTDAQEEAMDKIAEQIRLQYKSNVIGYRLILRLIHQYFIYEGVFPMYVDIDGDSLIDDEEEEPMTFGVQRELGE